MPVTRTWKVYGASGHRQRESFCDSYRRDFSKGAEIRIIEVFNSDKTHTNDFSIVRITRNTPEECELELDGQISDGIFENSWAGRIEEIENDWASHCALPNQPQPDRQPSQCVRTTQAQLPTASARPEPYPGRKDIARNTAYFVLCDAVNGNANWDTFCGLFSTHAAALDAAERQWYHLTAHEKKGCIITVNHVNIPDDIDLQDAYDYALEEGWDEDEVFSLKSDYLRSDDDDEDDDE